MQHKTPCAFRKCLANEWIKIVTQFIFTLSTLFLLSACVPVVIGSGAAIGTLATREKGVTGTMSDSQMSTFLKAKLYAFNPDLHAQVGVNVQNAEVLLTGTVQTPEWSVEAERMAWEVKGVKQVNNHIETTEDPESSGVIKDSWITTKIKTDLLFTENVRSLNYSIKTVNCVVYIMGIAQTQEELDYVTKSASTIDGVKKVVCYARLKDDPDA
jgi:osmotically-inducible protein OsmY